MQLSLFPQRQQVDKKVAYPSDSNSSQQEELERLILSLAHTFRRQKRIILTTILIFLGLGVAYLVATPPSYRGIASILLDPSRPNLLNSQAVNMPTMVLDTGMVESQVEILKSRSISGYVVRKHNLVLDEEIGGKRGILSTVINAIGGLFVDNPPLSEEEREVLTIEAFEKRLHVARVGLTYMIEVGYSSRDPQKAARIANAIADAYMQSQFTARFDATRRATEWLDERAKELQTRVIEADKAVEVFKTENNIIESSGRLLNEQQLSDTNALLSQARAATAEAQARYERMRDLVKKGEVDAASQEASNNPVVARLRTLQADLERREIELKSRFGNAHRLVTDTQSELRNVNMLLSAEFVKIVESLRNNFELSKSKEQSFEQSVSSLTGSSAVINEKQIKLRELQRDATSYRTLYDTFVLRHKEMLQQETTPILDSRIVTTATAPLKPFSPKSALVLAVALGAGILSGAAVAIIRERLDNVFRSTRDIEEMLNIDVLANTPLIEKDASEASSGVSTTGASLVEAEAATSRIMPVLVRPSERQIPVNLGMLREVVAHPFSAFAEAYRAVRVALQFATTSSGNPVRVIAITSTTPFEGKSTVSMNMAQHLAQIGQRVLLIDADMRNPLLSRQVCPEASAGLVEVLVDRTDPSSLIYTDPVTGLHFLPTVLKHRIPHTAELIGSQVMAEVLNKVKGQYDFVIVDTPPVLPVVDVRSVAPFIDTFLYVVEWGRTSRDLVSRAIQSTPQVRNKILGIILNKVNTKTAGLYDQLGSGDYHGYYYTQSYPVYPQTRNKG